MMFDETETVGRIRGAKDGGVDQGVWIDVTEIAIYTAAEIDP